MNLPVPNFVIIGAQKAGTTSLHEYLKEHPAIFMSHPIKEPGYFLDDTTIPNLWKRRGLDVGSREVLLSKYMLSGYAGQALFGESSTYYTIGRRGLRQEVPQRMAQVNPRMKFIYMLRDPIDRIRSNYLHSSRRKLTTGTIEQYLSSAGGETAVQTSEYFRQLSPYLALFPEDQFHVVIFEEFVRSPASHMERICQFLGAGPFPTPINYDPHNVSGNRTDVVTSGRLEITPQRLAVLRKRIGEDVRKLCDWLGREEIPDWVNLRA